VYQCFLLNAPSLDDVRAALKAKGLDASGSEYEQAFDRLALGYVLIAGAQGQLECPVPFVRELIQVEGNLEARLGDNLEDWAKPRRKPNGSMDPA
jgi:hypothetical protein